MISVMQGKIFRLQPWTSRVQATAQKLINDIRTVTPELEVLFMGAAALGLPGKNDIDLDILCQKENVATYTQKLKTVLGDPKVAKENLTVWEFELDGFEVDCILSDPTISHVPLQRKRFEKLQANPELLNKYRKLKEACDGLTYEEYEKRKVAFFEESVLSSGGKSDSKFMS